MAILDVRSEQANLYLDSLVNVRVEIVEVKVDVDHALARSVTPRLEKSRYSRRRNRRSRRLRHLGEQPCASHSFQRARQTAGGWAYCVGVDWVMFSEVGKS